VSKLLGPFYAYAESGPGWNFHSGQAVAQYFAGVKYAHAFGSSWSAGFSYGIGGISDITGKVQEASIFATFKF